MPACQQQTAADGALRVRRGCFSDGWEESIWELLFLISPGRELWSGDTHQTGLQRRQEGCRRTWPKCVDSRAGPPNRKLVQSYIHVLLTIELAGGMTAISLPAPQA